MRINNENPDDRSREAAALWPTVYTSYQHGPGWARITRPVVLAIEDLGGTVLQVKEKFGNLRLYYRDVPLIYHEAIKLMVEGAEQRCSHTCEQCGEDGYHPDHGDPDSMGYRARLRGGGYWQTLCDPCYQQRERSEQ
jgi:hypothetical protein